MFCPRTKSSNSSTKWIAYKNKPDIRPFSSGIKGILISGFQCTVHVNTIVAFLCLKYSYLYKHRDEDDSEQMEEVDEAVWQPRQRDDGDPEGEGRAVKVAELQHLPVGQVVEQIQII